MRQRLWNNGPLRTTGSCMKAIDTKPIMLLLLATAMASSAAPRPASVAVLAGAGDRAPGTGVLELLMAELSGQDGVTLVEREHIDRILSEQALTALLAAEPANAVRLGQLLAADLLVVVDRLSAQDPVALRLRIIETRTSVVLADLLREESDIATDAALLRERIDLALTRWHLPPENRHYVAILGFRSEEIGRQLSGVPEAVSMLLSVDLSASPSVILLDRANAQRLQAERDLTALELDIKSSMIGLEIFVRLLDDRQTCRLSVAFSSAAGERPTVRVEAPLDSISEARIPLAEAVLRRLNASTITPGSLSPAREADILGLQPGAAAAEAAYLLDPTINRLVRAAHETEGTRSRELMLEYWRQAYLRLHDAGHNAVVPDIFRLGPGEPLPVGAANGIPRLAGDLDLVARSLQHFGVTNHDRLLMQFANESYIALDGGRPGDTNAEWADFAGRILLMLVEAKDGRRLLAWLSDTRHRNVWSALLDRWLSESEGLDRLRMVDTMLSRMQSAGNMSRLQAIALERAAGDVRARLHELDRAPVAVPSGQSTWEYYSVTAYELPGRPKDATHLGALIPGPTADLYVWEFAPRRNQPFQIEPVVVDRGSRTYTSLGRADIAQVTGRSTAIYRQITGSAFDGVTAGVGTAAGGLAIFHDEQVLVLDRSTGLPASRVSAVAMLNGHVYFSMNEGFLTDSGDSVIYRYDPGTKAISELAASRREHELRNSLDGGPSYRVAAMLGDREGERVWLGVDGSDRTGIWTYKPRAGTWQHVLPRLNVDALTWSNGQLLMRMARANHARIMDPLTGLSARLLGTHGALFGRPDSIGWPVLMVGNHLLERRTVIHVSQDAMTVSLGSAYGINLHVSGARAPESLNVDAADRPITADFMIPLGEGAALVANRQGDAWLIRGPEDRDDEAIVLPWLGEQSGLSRYFADASDRVTVSRCAASSTAVRERAPVSSGPEALVDGSLTTSWSAGEDQAAGTWLTFTFDGPTALSKVLLVNGCYPQRPDSGVGRSHGLFSTHHRAKRVTLVADGGERVSWRLADVWFPQTFNLASPITTQHVRLLIDDIYPAETTAPDSSPTLTLTEVAFFGTPAGGP